MTFPLLLAFSFAILIQAFSTENLHNVQVFHRLFRVFHTLLEKTHSHSIVPGGLDVMSYTTRFTPFTSFTIRLEMVSNKS